MWRHVFQDRRWRGGGGDARLGRVGLHLRAHPPHGAAQWDAPWDARFQEGARTHGKILGLNTPSFLNRLSSQPSLDTGTEQRGRHY